MKHDVLGVLVVGLGRAGLRHVAACHSTGAFGLAGVVETNPGAARAGGVDSPVFQSLDQALDAGAVDAVVVSTPTPSHASLAIAALERGLHVLVEKPLAPTVGECDAILAALAKSEAVLMVGHTYHFDPVMRAARDLVRSGDLGRPVWIYEQSLRPRPHDQPAWMDDRAQGGGLLLTNGVHLIDRTAWLLDQFPSQVIAIIGRRFAPQDADDFNGIFLGFGSGVAACLVLGQPLAGAPQRVAEVLLTKGRVRYADRLEVDAGDGWVVVPTEPRDPFELQIESFANAIQGAPVSPNGWWGREVVRIAELAERQAEG